MDHKECCFCHKAFKKVGAHYKSCPERKGQSFQHLLAEKTINSRHKSKKTACPKCGKLFLRLDTHLKNSASCKDLTQPSQNSLGVAHPTISSSLSPHSHHSISHCSHLPEVVLPPNPHSDVLPPPTHPSQSSVVPLTSPLFSVPVPPIPSSTNCVPSIGSHASVYVPPFESDLTLAVPSSQSHPTLVVPPSQSHPTLVVPPSQSHPILVVPPSQSHTPLVVPPSQSHPTLVVPSSQSHTPLVVPPSQSHTPLIVPPSQSHTPLIVPPSQSHTPLIVPPSQTSNTAPSTDSHKLSHKIVQPSLHPPHVPCSSHAPPVSPAPIPPPPSRATPEQATLPTPKLPSSPREWAEADQHFKDTLVPSVLDCRMSWTTSFVMESTPSWHPGMV